MEPIHLRGVAQVGSDCQSERLTMVLMINLVLIINLINPSTLLALEHCSDTSLVHERLQEMYSPKTLLILGKVKLYFIQDMTKAIQFSETFRYNDNLFITNYEEFGNHISTIYPSELELKCVTRST